MSNDESKAPDENAFTAADGDDLVATGRHRRILPRSRAADKDLQSLNDELTTANEGLRREADDRLRYMAAELTRCEQRERARMARLLHDHLQQLLVSAKMRLQALARTAGKDAKEELDAVVALVDESLEGSRGLAVELFPPILNEGLAPALEWLGSVWMKEKHRLSVALDLDPRVDAAGEELRALVFMAVRELLFNVVKHADASEASVELTAADSHTLCVSVTDRGRGCDPSVLKHGPSEGSGLGLFTVRQRLRILGGSLSLDSAEGEGVEAVIHAPRGPDLPPKPSN